MAPTGSANDAMNAPVNDGQTVTVSTLDELVDLLREPLPRVAHKDRPRLGDIDPQARAAPPPPPLAPPETVLPDPHSGGRRELRRLPQGRPAGVRPRARRHHDRHPRAAGQPARG